MRFGKGTRLLFGGFLACGLLTAFPRWQIHAAEPPNILFVLADQWRGQAFGYSGDPNVRTPHIDTLQRQGIRFINAVSSVPVCSPARASLLTGQRALTHGVFLNDVALSPDALTLAKVLARAGYDTGYIGKWHLNGDGRSAFIPRERRQGFDYWKALECTHDYNHSLYYSDSPEKLVWEGYDAAAQTRDAQRYLRDHAGAKKPFFLFLAWGPPHDPYQTAPREYRDEYQADSIKLRDNVPATLSESVRAALAGYYAHCAALDHCVGDLLDTLRQTGLAENTLVAFTSDHGDLIGSHGQFNKQQPYDESIRVPLLLSWPKAFGTSGLELDAPIGSEDIMPTILGLCGVPIPKAVEGLDYGDYLRGGKDPSDGAVLIACPAPFGQWERRHGGREYRGIRTRRYTYARDARGPWFLFDNQADPFQMHNLVDQPALAGLRMEFEALLARKLKAAGDEFLPAAAYIRKWGYQVDTNGTVPYTP
ncbi:MAG: sulfatase [Limisphaerales bacterium]